MGELEETVAQLEKDLATANEKITEQSIEVEVLEAAKATLQKELDELKNSETSVLIEDLQAGIAERDMLIDQLNGTIAKQDKAKTSDLPVVQHGEEMYQIVFRKFKINGLVKTAEDVQSDSKLVEELLESKSGVLRLFKEEAK